MITEHIAVSFQAVLTSMFHVVSPPAPSKLMNRLRQEMMNLRHQRTNVSDTHSQPATTQQILRLTHVLSVSICSAVGVNTEPKTSAHSISTAHNPHVMKIQNVCALPPQTLHEVDHSTSTYVYWIRDHVQHRSPGTRHIEASTHSNSRVDNNRHQRACRKRDVVQHCHKNILRATQAMPQWHLPRSMLPRRRFCWLTRPAFSRLPRRRFCWSTRPAFSRYRLPGYR